jgi:hypothetical protein
MRTDAIRMLMFRDCSSDPADAIVGVTAVT